MLQAGNGSGKQPRKQDVKVRQALAMALDLDGYVQALGGERAVGQAGRRDQVMPPQGFHEPIQPLR